jgi:hypothetical protein
VLLAPRMAEEYEALIVIHEETLRKLLTRTQEIVGQF